MKTTPAYIIFGAQADPMSEGRSIPIYHYLDLEDTQDLPSLKFWLAIDGTKIVYSFNNNNDGRASKTRGGKTNGA